MASFSLARLSLQSRRFFATGTTKWFNVKKGFGFIKPDVEGEPDLFVHQTAIQASGFRFLNEAEKVTYDVERTDKGPQAANVRDAGGKPFSRPYTNPTNPSFQGGESEGTGGMPPRERRSSSAAVGGGGGGASSSSSSWSDSPASAAASSAAAPAAPAARPAPRPRTPRATAPSTSTGAAAVPTEKKE